MMVSACLRNSLAFGLVLCTAGFGPALQAAEPDVPAEPLFSRHVVPVLSRLGCNAGGGCHGAPKGQNGFRLSLWGGHPDQDYQAILRSTLGRRVNLQDVESSLLLLKPSGQVAHMGGTRFAPGSRDYLIVKRWLERGAPLDNFAASKVKSFRVEPIERLAKPGESFQIRVEATFADGSVEDVTRLCSYNLLEEAVGSVDAHGLVTVKAAGESPIFIRFRGTPLVAQVLVPVDPQGAFPLVKAHNFIDEEILAKLKRLNMHPAGLCDDATFLRRACLDIAGTLPTPEEIRGFLADKDPGKRAKKIDALLKHPGHAALWATIFCDMMRPGRFNGNHGFEELAETRRFYEWIRARLVENVPYDRFVERILTATSYEGRSQDDWLQEVMSLGRENASRNPDLPTYAKRQTLDLYWQRDSSEVMGVRGALRVGYQFMGLQLECAQCHRHPHDVWQQEDVLDFANFFSQLRASSYPSAKELTPENNKKWKALQAEAAALREQAKKSPDKAKELNEKANALTTAAKRFGTAIYHDGGKTRWASITSPLGTQKSSQFRLLGVAQPMWVPDGEDPRQIVMRWLRDHKANRYFAKAMVNRVWAQYMGRGIVDPPDNMSTFNPPTHPRLLEKLADEFVARDYDLRWLHRTIVMSRTYQQSSEAHATSRGDRKNFASYYLRRHMAEVLVDAVDHALGSKTTFPPGLFMPSTAKAIELPGITEGPPPKRKASLQFAIDLFGRPKRDLMMMCDCERDNGSTVMHTLYLANNPRVREKIEAKDGRLTQVMKEFPDDRRRVEELFLWVVSRPPTPGELTACVDYVKESPTARKGLEDVLWSLLNTREFILAH